MIGSVYNLSEQDQILIPTSAGYKAYPLLDLLNVSDSSLRSTANFGMPPVRFITQRGPFQDGETVLDLRYDPRVIQIFMARYLANRSVLWDERNTLFDYIRPSRSFDANASQVVKPLIYRHYMPGGKPERGADLTTTNGSAIVTSVSGRFLHFGGISAGDYFEITNGADVGTYAVVSVANDYTLTLNANMGADAANVHWRYLRGRATRDLLVLAEQGPSFDARVDVAQVPTGYRETIRFIAHSPFWFGEDQTETWAISDALGDLVFDGEGAWFGVTSGTGRWLFAPNYIGETVAVVYWGTEPAKPIIEIDGPAINPVIENSTIGVRLELDYAIAAGELVTIDTLALTVKNNTGDNLFPYLSGDLATFQLSPRPQAPNRINDVTVNFSGANAGTSAARLLWKNQYTGI